MSVFKRGDIYWYKFVWKGEPIRCSTRQRNKNTARTMEAAHRTSLAKGLVGIREKKAAPSLREFCETRFEAWARSTFEKTTPNNWLWFRGGMRPLLAFKPLANAPLDTINGDLASQFARHRQAEHKEISTVNSALRVLRRILGLAAEWGVIETRPRISLLAGERHRDTVVTEEQERLYLNHAQEPIRSIAIVLVGTGLRPDECYRLRWEDVNWSCGDDGTLQVTQGKTPAARRMIAMTQRVRFILETRWELAKRPTEGWLWPAPTKAGHVNHSSLKKQHARAFLMANTAVRDRNKSTGTTEREIQPWVLYALRHTFLTRLGQSGCDAWTLAKIAGHSSITMSSRYVHPSDKAVFAAMFRMGGHNFGHSAETAKDLLQRGAQQAAEEKGEVWCARRDSNSRPIAPEAIALSS
jgi:integrase